MQLNIFAFFTRRSPHFHYMIVKLKKFVKDMLKKLEMKIYVRLENELKQLFQRQLQQFSLEVKLMQTNYVKHVKDLEKNFEEQLRVELQRQKDWYDRNDAWSRHIDCDFLILRRDRENLAAEVRDLQKRLNDLVACDSDSSSRSFPAIQEVA